MGITLRGVNPSDVLNALVGQNVVMGSVQTTGTGPAGASPTAANAYLGSTGGNYAALWLGVSPAAGNYALKSSSAGDVSLNAPTGQSIIFTINNSAVGTWNASSLTSVGSVKAQGANGVLSDSGLVQASGANTKITLYGNVTDGGTAVNAAIDTSAALSTAGAKILSLRNNAVEKAFIDKDGGLTSLVTSGNNAVTLNDLAKVAWSQTNISGNGTTIALNSNGASMIDANRTGPVVRAYCGSAPTPFDISGTLNVNTTAVGNVGASGPDDLITYAVPLNTLTVTGRGIEVIAWGTTANNANAKTVRLVFGGTTLVTKQLTVSVAGTWSIRAVILRTGASAQTFYAEAMNDAATTLSSTDGATVLRICARGTATETETAAITVKGQSTVSTADNDIVQQGQTTRYF